MKITMPKPKLWQDLPGMHPPVVQRTFQGVNRLDPFAISDEYASDMLNLTSSAYPAITVRPGYSVLGAIGTKVLGIGVWKDQQLHAVFNDGTWQRWTGTGWVTLASGLNTSAPWTFTNYQGNLGEINLFGSNGVDAIRRYDGGHVQVLAGAPSGGDFITHYQDRLWCAVGSKLHACALGQPTQWSLFNGDDADSYYKEIESPAGETITALKSGLSKLTIGMPKSIHLLFGGVPSEFQTRPVTFDTGIINNFAADTLDGTMMLLDASGIHQFNGGTLPDREFSTVVQDYMNRMDAAGRDDACVGIWNQRLYCSLPIGSIKNNTILEYDVQARLWNVWGGISAVCFARLGEDLYIGDALGRVLKMGGTSDNGVPIEWHWVSKPYTSPSMAQKLRWYRSWTVADLAAGSTMKAYLSKSEKGDSDWELTKSVTARTGLQAIRIEVPLQLAQADWVRDKIAGTGPATIHEKTRIQRQMPIF